MLTEHKAPDATEVTVFGDTETAMFAAIWLAEQGKRTTLISPGDDVGIDTNDMERGHLHERLTELGVTVRTGESDPGSGTVVWATPRTPSTVWSQVVDDDRILTVGTRFRGGRMYEATQSGFWTAAHI